jgi:ribosomal protein S18 acetylase RimI-like enzyme
MKHQQSFRIRAVVPEDLPALKKIIQANDMFPPELLDDMISGFFEGTSESGFWLTIDEPKTAAVAYCAPEPMTNGTWNLYLIAVDPNHHGKGIGAALMKHIEERLAAEGVRILIVETSGLERFTRTRGFYQFLGYEQEARIRDFYDAGDDKIVFRKALISA